MAAGTFPVILSGYVAWCQGCSDAGGGPPRAAPSPAPRAPSGGPGGGGPGMVGSRSRSPAGTATETETWPPASGVANGQTVAQRGRGRPDNTANKIEALAE
jgi:hypothetical protein